MLSSIDAVLIYEGRNQMRDEMIKIVEDYLDGLRRKDLSRIAFDPDVTFESPLSPKLTCERAVVNFLSGLLPAIKDIRATA